jgi:hypothetical protein
MRGGLFSAGGPVAQWIERHSDEIGGCRFESCQGHASRRRLRIRHGVSFYVFYLNLGFVNDDSFDPVIAKCALTFGEVENDF